MPTELPGLTWPALVRLPLMVPAPVRPPLRRLLLKLVKPPFKRRLPPSTLMVPLLVKGKLMSELPVTLGTTALVNVDPAWLLNLLVPKLTLKVELLCVVKVPPARLLKV